MSGAAIYARASDLGGASPRETEIIAFGLCNARLSRAITLGERVAALHKTHELWSILFRDLSSDANQLPPHLRSDLIALAVWAMRYSVAAMSSDAALQPLIEVNRNVADGLRAQQSRTPSTMPAARNTPQGLQAFSA